MMKRGWRVAVVVGEVPEKLDAAAAEVVGSLPPPVLPAYHERRRKESVVSPRQRVSGGYTLESQSAVDPSSTIRRARR